MFLIVAQVMKFYKDSAQMAILHATVIQLQNEGIDTIEDLADFDKDMLT